ncbi:hypothetical protein OCK74_26005 [Chitinophagaceae bacterium LB-8]|uniref:DUF3471 domain-containing protein n=1 Tax=Paraflavisolibacter caeni TaxID=2982496 RepID=A0A9X2Y0C2_9BACT|nr:hypothetical protein [Paraflavisolibacter caeni]MCU7552600.1 hypothetical protein [Paraflavisolibacter caeni]
MKKQLVARIKMYGKSLFFTTSAILILNIAANAQAATTKTSDEEKAVITHLQSKDATSLFNVKYPNENGGKFSLVIKDETGAVLFSEVYDEKNFNKRFLFTDIDKDAKLRFTFSSLKNRTSQTFEISPVTRVIDDVVVTRL